jgi:hypothetical protein
VRRTPSALANNWSRSATTSLSGTRTFFPTSTRTRLWSIRSRALSRIYNQRDTAEQWIREGKNANTWTRLSCHRFTANAVRLQLHALAYNHGNLIRTLAMPETVEPWSLTGLRKKLIKIGAKVVSHGYVTFQMAEVAAPRELFGEILRLIEGPRPRPVPA